jgi:ribose transport system permease protein
MSLSSTRGMRPGHLRRILGLPFTRALLALVLIVLLGAVFNADGAFYKWQTHRETFRQTAVYGILACGMTIVIITAGIDLSVGSVLGLVAVLFSILTIRWNWGAWLAVPACILAGAACGGVSGGIIARFKVQPFIATLAMMVFARGLAKYVTGGMKISTMAQDASGKWISLEEPAIFGQIDTALFGGNLAVVTLVLLACLAVSHVFLSASRPGRYMYAIGGGEEAALLSGVRVGLMKVLAYALSGAFAAVAGICQAAQDHQGDPNAGETHELTAIAIVVIGGTSLMGGRGSVLLTLLGTLTIGYLEKVLSINAVGDASRLMLTGAIIVTAVLLQRRKD